MTAEPASRLRRPICMRRSLGALLAAAALAMSAACGSATSSADTGGPNGGGPATPTPGSTVPGARTVLVSQTAAGGRVSARASLLDTPGHLAAFTRQFRMPAMRNRVHDAADRLAKTGHVVVGAVVAVGCDQPPGVDVVYGEDTSIRLLPHEVATPLPECVAPVTTVALASVPGSD